MNRRGSLIRGARRSGAFGLALILVRSVLAAEPLPRLCEPSAPERATPCGLGAPEGPWVLGDGRDRYTLLDKHPVNRQLFRQLGAQPFRLGRWDRFSVAADAAIGTQQTIDADEQSRFHGYSLVDTYFAVRLLDGLDANLNVVLVNPSASDGYRLSSQLSAGLALHGYYDLALWDETLRLDLVGTDLDWVTLGNGLLLERVPLEGMMAGASLRDWAVRYLYGGRGFWADDDVIATILETPGRWAALTHTAWQRTGIGRPKETIRYVSLAIDAPVDERFRFAGEYAARFGGTMRSGVLARADFLSSERSPIRVHTGYQFRFYERDFGPDAPGLLPSRVFSTIHQEDVYVTNSFEYFGRTRAFDQWSHTLVLEIRARLWPHLAFFGDAEQWLREAQGGALPVVTPDGTETGFAAPGRALRFFYKAGLSLFPWPRLPHRLNGFVTNKQVFADRHVATPVFVRFDPGTYYVLELEAFL